MKSANCISVIGRMPSTAAPIAVPMMPDSASGVSITRSGPNSSMKPSGTLKAPPKTPMSSPLTRTRASLRISSRMPAETARREVSGAMSRPRREAAPRRVAVAEHDLVAALVEDAVGRRVRVGHRHGEGLLRPGLDRLADLGADGVRVDAEIAQARLLALDGVLLAPL